MDTKTQTHLKRINHFAGLYNQRQSKALKYGTEQEAIKWKYKRDSLYQLKYALIEQHRDAIKKTELHHINEREYYCVYYSDSSFHIPTDTYMEFELTDSDSVHLDEFQKTVSDESQSELVKSLKYIKQEYSLTPNQFISDHCVQTEYGTVIVKWRCI